MMWTLWTGWLRARQIGDTAEIAVATALGLEAPAQIRAALYAKLRRTGAKIARPASAVAFILVVVLAIEAAKARGLSETQTHWAVFPAVLGAIWIAFPKECAKVFAAFGEALRAFAKFFSLNGAAIQLVGRVAYWGALAALIAYCCLYALETTKWLPDEDKAFIKLLKPDVRHAFFTCFVVVVLYRVTLAGLTDFLNDFGWRICVWWIANMLIVWSILVGTAPSAPPDFESLDMMFAAPVVLMVMTFVLAANHEFFQKCVAWTPTSPTGSQPLPQTSGASPVLVPVRAPRDHVLT